MGGKGELGGTLDITIFLCTVLNIWMQFAHNLIGSAILVANLRLSAQESILYPHDQAVE